MFTHAKRIGLAVLAGVGVFAAVPATAVAQPFQVAPGLSGQNPYSAGTGTGGNQNSGFFNRNFNPMNNNANQGGGNYNDYNLGPYAVGRLNNQPNNNNNAGYGGYGGFSPFSPWGFGFDIFGGNLRGSAEVIDAGGRLMTSTQQAYLLREQLKREKMENRHRMLQEWLWEREVLPTAQDEFERTQRLEVRRAQNDPPINEILSGKALNDLLVDIEKLQGKGLKGPDIPLDSELLNKVNLTPPGKGSANVGVLKNDGKLEWPIALRANNFKKDRDLVSALTPEAINQARGGQVDAATLQEMRNTVEKIRDNLTINIKEIPTKQYIDAKKFLNDLDDGLKALSDRDAKNFFGGSYTPKGKNVQDVIENMTKQGLRFAPSVPGEEAAYVALHRLMAAFDVSLNNAAASSEQR